MLGFGRFYPVSIPSLSRPIAFMSLRVPMKRIILFAAGLGIIFLASAVQTFGTNWLGQACRNPACLHLEWLAGNRAIDGGL